MVFTAVFSLAFGKYDLGLGKRYNLQLRMAPLIATIHLKRKKKQETSTTLGYVFENNVLNIDMCCTVFVCFVTAG